MTSTANPAADTGLHEINRRTLLQAAPLAAAMVAAPALALGSAPVDPDPALTAIAAWERVWRAAWGAEGACRVFDEDSPEWHAAYQAEHDAHSAACNTRATTAAGLAAQLRLAYTVF